MQLSVQMSARPPLFVLSSMPNAMWSRLAAPPVPLEHGTLDALWWNMRPLDGTRLTHVVTHLFQDVYYWCGISGWGVAGLFAVLIGAIGTFTNFRMDRLLVRARASERSSRVSSAAPFVR